MRCVTILPRVSGTIVLSVWCLSAATAEDREALVTRAALDRLLDSTVHNWRFRLGDVTGAEQTNYCDSSWGRADVGHQWWPHDSTCWYRKRLVIPKIVNGIPVAGSTVRLKVGMDNEAKAYVNGEFRQQFTWADGDLVLTENAQPGDVVTIALQGINRAGYGSLYKAELSSDTSEAVVSALRNLLEQCDYAVSDTAYVTQDEAAHWQDLVEGSLQTLDMRAYRAANRDGFLASLERARAVLLRDSASLESGLASVQKDLDELKSLIEQGNRRGLQLAYQRSAARVVDSFLAYAREDMNEGSTRRRIRAIKIAAFLNGTCHRAMCEVRAALDVPLQDPRVPVYQTGPIALRDGAFWQGDRPVFFTGVGHFGQVRQDVPILPEYGLNIIQIEMGPNSVVLENGAVDDRPIREDVLRVLDNAAAHHVAVNLLISPHYFPSWAIQKNPALGECGHGFMKHCIDAPESREIHRRYLETLMPLIKDHPALHSICLSNEPHYKGTCAYSKEKFHRWIKAKYKRIGRVRELYGGRFSSFEDVPIPKDASNYALFFDWCRFNQDRFLEFHEFLRDIIHQHDPDLPVHAKVMSLAFEDPGRFELGINHEDFNGLGSIAGNDCWTAFHGEQENDYVQGWLTTAINYTLQHSTHPDSPIFNSEDHIIADGEKRYIPSSHIRTAYWLQALHGQGAATTWVWERGQSGDFAENILTRPNCALALGRISLDLQRLSPEVHALQRAKADVAILYAYSSLLPSPFYSKEAKAAFEGAYFADTICDFVTERQVMDGRLSNYKLALIPRAAYAPDAVVEGFQRYIASGGTVMTVSDAFIRDEYGRPRKSTLEQKGQGRLVVYPDPLTPFAYREILSGLLEATTCRRLVKIRGHHGELLWGINVRAVERNGRLLASLVNYLRQPQSVVLKMEQPIARITNLFENRDVTLPLELPPLEPMLVSITCAGSSD